MKISIKEGGSNFHFTIYLPNMLLTGALARWIINKALEHAGTDCNISAEQIVQMARTLTKAVRVHGHFELVRVESHDGDTVIIQV